MRAPEREARADRVVALWRAGLTSAQIAGRVGVTTHSAGRILKARGLVPHAGREDNGDLNKALDRAAPLGSPFSPVRRG